MTQLRDYSLNFENDKTSYNIEDQLPLFVRKDDPDFVNFLKEYYRFLETKITKITVVSDDANSINAIVENDLLSTSHMLMVNDGVEPDIQITGFEFTPYMEWCESFANTSVKDIVSVYDPYHQKSIIFYNDIDDNNYSYYVVISLNDMDVVPSEPALFMGGVARKIDATYDANSNKILVAYLNADISNHAFVVDCEIGNNTFTTGISAVINSDVTSRLKVVDLPNEKFCVFYTNEGVEIKSRITILNPSLVSIGSNAITARITIPEYSNTITRCLIDYYEILVGNDLIIEGAIGTQEEKFNGTWTIKSVTEDNGDFLITFAVDETIASGTYTENIGDVVLYYSTYRKEMTICDLDVNGIFVSERNVFSDNDYQYISPVYDWQNNKLIVSYLDFLNGYGASTIVHIMGYDIRVGKENIFNSGLTLDIFSLYVGNGKHVILYQDVDNNSYGTLSIGTFNSNKIEYKQHFVFSDVVTKDIKAAYNTSNDKLTVIYNEIGITPAGVSKIVDISEDIAAGGKSIFSGFGVSYIDVYFDPIIKKDIILHGSEDLSTGRVGVFNPYQFLFDIVNPGYGMTCNVEIVFGDANPEAVGAFATGVINESGAVEYIIVNHGFGYTEAPPIAELIVDDLFNIYLGEGTEDNPVIELSDYKGIDGKIIGYVDIDVNDSGQPTRKDIFIEHYSGALERADYEGNYGEIFNPEILNNLTKDAPLPKILQIIEVETPVYAMNNMHNFEDIDYSFNSKLFLGNDLYSLMYKEIMGEWPMELVPSIENKMKAIIGRNIIQFYKSLGTEDAIRFVIKLIYDRDSNVWSAGDRLFKLNSGNWYQTNKLLVGVDIEGDVLSATGRMVYNISKLIVDTAIHDTVSTLSITTVAPHGLKTGSHVTILNDPKYEGSYEIIADNDTTFSITIAYASVEYTQPISTIQISNYYGVIESVEAIEMLIEDSVHDELNSLTITSHETHNLSVNDYIYLLNDTEYTGAYRVDSVTDLYIFSITSEWKDRQLSQLTTYTTDVNVYLTDISGTSFIEGEYIKSNLSTGEEFECKIKSDIQASESYADNHNLLNGSVIQPLPYTFAAKSIEGANLEESWDGLSETDRKLAGFLAADIINTDRIQDGDLYQLYSYVIQIAKKAPYILEKYSEEEVKNTIRKLTHPAGFKVTIKEI